MCVVLKHMVLLLCTTNYASNRATSTRCKNTFIGINDMLLQCENASVVNKELNSRQLLF